MKKIKLLFLLLVLMSLTACGQQKKYVSYTVKKGETMKSIAKENGLKTRDLLRLNPDVSRRPDPNTVIIIPNKNKVKKTSTKSDNEITHIVKKKETLYSISKEYGIGVEDLKKANGLTGNSISIGRELKIPSKKEIEDAKDNEEGSVSEGMTYTVEQDDTIYSLSRRFNMTEEELKSLNPAIATDGLQLGMVLNLKKISATHIVEKDDTIYSLSKQYNLTEEELLELNPAIATDGLQLGMVLSLKEISATHIVEKDDTIYSLSKQYNLTEEELLVLNPAIATDGLQLGMVLNLKEIITTHIVEKDETIYSLSKQYNLTEEELLELNPAIATDGLQLGMVINIKQPEIEVEEEITFFVDKITDKPLNVALMLPYNLNNIDNFDEKFKNKTSLLNIVTDFHSGVLVAIDSLKNQGLNVNLKVFDTQNDKDKIESILDDNDFDDIDVVIGPLFLKNAKMVAKKVGSTPVIAPMFSKEQESISQGSLVKVAPNKELLEEKLTNYMLDNYSGEKIIIVYDTITVSPSRILKISDELKKHDSINEITIVKPENGYIKKERFIEVIDTIQRKNWVLLIGKDNVTTNDVVNNLGVISKEKAEIQLFAFDYGANFVNVSNYQLGRLHFTYPKEEFTDILNDATKVFQKKYKKKYYSYPSRYAIKGFDVTYDTLLRLVNFDSFKEGSKAGISQRIGAKFNYKKKLFGSTENRGIFLIQYQEDLKLKSLE